MGKLTLYVYYKVPIGEQIVCLSALHQLQKTIQLRFPDVISHRQKRPSVDATAPATWMEIYAEIVPEELDVLIADLLELAGIYGLPCERRNEVFINL